MSSTTSDSAERPTSSPSSGSLSKRALRVRDLVVILSLPKTTVHDLIRRGDIRAVSLGSGRRRILLIPVEEVERILNTSPSRP